jgi:protein phosphatase
MKHDDRFGLRYAAGSDAGVARTRNEDSVFASPRLLAVADGMGGHAHGDIASATTIGALVELDGQLQAAEPGEIEPMSALTATVAEALRRITELAEQDHDLTSMGSTLTALLWNGKDFTLAHVGDSRAYLLREGALHQLTKDHTLVQSLVDKGRITEAEAADHPRRSMLIRALQAGGTAEPDVTPLPATPGDRVLLCSDGITAVVPPATIHTLLAEATTPAEAVHQLIEAATRLQSPDNVSCVVAEVTTSPQDGEPQIAGAAATITETTHAEPATREGRPDRTTPAWLPRWARNLLPN